MVIDTYILTDSMTLAVTGGLDKAVYRQFIIHSRHMVIDTWYYSIDTLYYSIDKL